MNLPQDNEPLRTRINMTLEAYGLSTVSQRAEDNCIDALLALVQSEQTRLKSELIAKVRESLPPKVDKTTKTYLKYHKTGYNACLTEVSAALDTLERGA